MSCAPQVAMRSALQIWQIFFPSQTLQVFCFSFAKPLDFLFGPLQKGTICSSEQWFFFLFFFLVFYFFCVFNGQFCDVTKVTIIPKKKKEELKKGPNSPTSPTMKVLFLKKKEKVVLP
jgi:hypothetical protein